MKYKELTKENIKNLRRDLEKFFDSFYITHGVMIKTKNITYESDRFHCKIEGTVSGAPSKEESDYEKYRGMHNLPPLYTVIEFQGEMYKIIGFKPRAHKRPVVVKDKYSGKQFVMSISMAQNAEIVA